MSYSPAMRDNPGNVLDRSDLPADQDTQTVILGSLISLGISLVAVLGVEYAVAMLPTSVGLLLRTGAEVALGVAGIWVASYYPVIGAAILGGAAVSASVRVLNAWNVGPRQLEAPAST